MPAVAFDTVPGFVAAAFFVSLAVGLAGGVLPACRAVRRGAEQEFPQAHDFLPWLVLASLRLHS